MIFLLDILMRFVLFYSDVESFNYFTDRIVEELNKKNHECFVLDLRDMSESGEHSFERFNSKRNLTSDYRSSKREKMKFRGKGFRNKGLFK